MTTAAQPQADSRKPRRSRIKKIGDGTILITAILISVAALAVCWFGARTAETGILRYEAKMAARSWTIYLLDNLPTVANIMAGQGVTEDDRSVIGAAIGAGGVLGFQIISSDGRVVYASRQGDIGTETTARPFRATVQKGNIHAEIKGFGPISAEPQVISEAFVPVIGGGRFLGAIKVEADVTARAGQLSRIGYLSFLGLLGFILLIALVMTALVAKNFEGNLRAKRALATSRKRLESYQGQLVQVKEDAEAENQMRSGIVADVIREIRTPIGGVIDAATALSDSELTESQRECVGTIALSAENVRNAVDNVLDYTRIESGAIEMNRVEFDLGRTITEAVGAHTRAAANKAIEYGYYVAADVPALIWGDPKRIEQILLTLIDGAVQRTDRGEVMLRVAGEQTSSGSALVRFELIDTSSGMELDDRNRLIAGLEQAPMSGGGADLALSICGQLVREMGGTITVGDSSGQGTRLSFAIPFDIAADTPARQPEQLEKLTGKRVLVVDDNATTREIFVQSFADWSIEAEGAEDGPSALESLKQADEQAKPFHVVVVDMSMPEMTGLDLAKAIRSEPSLQHLCLVLLTTSDVPAEEIETGETAVSARIEKPVHGVALLDQVISAIIEAPAIQRDVSAAESATTPDVESEAEPGPGNELAEKYLRHTLISLEKLRDAVASEKAGAVQMTADSLKSSSLDIGATALAGLCRELEAMARVGNLGGVHSMLDSIEQEYAKVCETLRAELSMDTPPSEEADPPPAPSS